MDKQKSIEALQFFVTHLAGGTHREDWHPELAAVHVANSPRSNLARHNDVPSINT
jgi:hypothetical protein